MVGLKQLFKPVKNMDSAEAKSFLAKATEGLYTLLDVRQPKEYEQNHIPGAKLIPLPQLDDSLSQIDPDQPILVY
jgi:rhodanese-related sulfurtransferase